MHFVVVKIMSVSRNFFMEQRRHFVYPFQAVNEALQMDIHKTV